MILIVIIVVLIGVCFKLYKNKKESEMEVALAEKEMGEYAELGKGLAEYNQKMQERKNQAKEKIMAMLEAKAKINNYDVAKSLNTSSASARRYLDELENEGKIKQVGKSGKKVYYSNSLRPV